MVNIYFMLPHNILPLRVRLAAFGLGDGLCSHCGSPEAIKHLFLECARICDLWDCFYSRVARIVPAILSDLELLRLDFEAVSKLQERLVLRHLGTFVSEVGEARNGHRPLARQELAAAFRALFPGCQPFF